MTAPHDFDAANRLPPHSPEAERATLGAMLRDNGIVPEVAARLTAGDFYFDAHLKIFRAVTALVADGTPADLVTTHEKLKALGYLADAGGAAYLAELWDAAPTAASWEHYAGIVRERAARRSAIHAATEAVRDLHDGIDPAAEVVARCGNAFDAAVADRDDGGFVTVGEAAALGLADYERRADPNALRLNTGFAGLDGLIGGYEPGQLVIVGARPAVGKSALGLAFALNLSYLHGVPTLLVSLEMPAKEIGQRATAFASGASAHRLKAGRGTDHDWSSSRRAAADLAAVPMVIRDRPGQKVAHVEAAARRMKRRGGLGLVLIDYLQLVLPDDPRSPRREQVGQVSRALKLAARRLDVPIVAMAQLNRDADDRPDGPRLSDLREAGDIEQDADIVMLLWRHPNQQEDAECWQIGCRVAKQRNGPVGELALSYRRASMRFEDPLPVGV